MTTLSVNVNKIALVRNSRDIDRPSVIEAARVCLEAGAHGITVHPRPDQRHIRPGDVTDLKALLQGTKAELNIEGNPFAGAEGSYPGFMEIVRRARPAQATLVPDDPGQKTSDHGFNMAREAARLKPLVSELKALGVRVSVVCPGRVKTPIFDRTELVNCDRDKTMKIAAAPPGITPETCARRIIEGMDRNQDMILPSLYAQFMWTLERLHPRLVHGVMCQTQRLAADLRINRD